MSIISCGQLVSFMFSRNHLLQAQHSTNNPHGAKDFFRLFSYLGQNPIHGLAKVIPGLSRSMVTHLK